MEKHAEEGPLPDPRGEIEVALFATLEDVDSGEWDSIVPEDEILNSYGYQLAIERSGVNDFRYRYLVMRRKGRLVAHVTVGIFTFGLDGMIGGAMKGPIARIKRVFPSFMRITLIECGHPTALGNTFAVADPEDMPEVLKLTAAEMARTAGAEGTSLCAIRDVYASERARFDALLDDGYRVAPNLSNTFIRIREASFEEYLDGLVAKRRREIRQRLAAFRKSGCTIERIDDFAGISGELLALWRETFGRAKEYQREVLTGAYFSGMSEQLGGRSFVLLCRQGGRPIGFTMLLDSGDTLISTYCGLDYELNRSTYAYFVLFYRSIEEAISMGKEWLELGITNYVPKMEVGAIPEPLAIYVKSDKPLVNLLFAPLLRLGFAPLAMERRRIFNERRYRRCAIRDPVVVRLENGAYLMKDEAERGFSLEGEEPLGGGTQVVHVGPAGKFGLSLTARVKDRVKLGPSRWRMALTIVGMDREHAPSWDDYLQRRLRGAEAD
jgi:hypothetical protein